jgi:hypothetical protein
VVGVRELNAPGSFLANVPKIRKRSAADGAEPMKKAALSSLSRS